MKMKRLLITGAAGMLGRLSRERLGHLAEVIRLSDVAEMSPAGANEEVMQADLGDAARVREVVEGCDAILHLGGVAVERTFDEIRNGNLTGLYNVYESARKAGVKRILFASSNHAIGFHPREKLLDADSTFAPDSLYGVSKVFGEAVAQLYWEKFGIETARVRIGSCFPEPRDHRMLATWLSPDDFVRLCEAVFRAPRLGCPVIYGASANAEQWWDNSKSAYVGWVPQDSAEAFRARLDAAMTPPDRNDPVNRFQGGGFAAAGHYED